VTDLVDTPRFAPLKDFAERHGMELRAFAGDQREPGAIVALVEQGRSETVLDAESRDSVFVALAKLENKVSRFANWGDDPVLTEPPAKWGRV
jgi:hypothetical protein